MEQLTIRLLLVEDDPDDTLLLRDMLGDVPGVSVTLRHAPRLSAALELADAERPEAVLMDLSLPDSQGLDTFVEFHRQQPEVPVVVLTGLNDETVAVRAVHEGAQDYLVKGQVSGSLLVRSLRYAIERGRTSHYLALLAERERFDTAISQMSDGIVVTDNRWRLTHANRAACLLLNLAPEAWTGLSLSEVLGSFTMSVPLDQLDHTGSHFTAFEVARTDTHPPLYLDARLSCLLDAQGNMVSVVLVLRDVTNERLARHVQANFLSAVPHKLRTPLSILGGYLELARKLSPEQLVEQWPHLAGVCNTELKSLADIVDKLLDFDKLSSTQLEAELRHTDVAGVAERVGAWVRKRYPDRALELEVAVPPEAAEVGCTNEHLAFILGELLDNAVKFADKEPVEVRLTGEVRADGQVLLTFTDNGPGIPHEYYDRIFEGFVQVEEFVTGQIPGLGIGLRLARQIVEAYGGQIAVKSVIGEGTTFSFDLPAGT